MLEGFIDVTAIARAGVYALVRDGVVVYVGQSKKMLSRIAAHRSNWGRKSMPAWMPASIRGILFDEVHVLPCRLEDLNRIEAAMIDFYKPRLNLKLKAPTPVATPFNLRTPSGITVPFNQPTPTQPFPRRF